MIKKRKKKMKTLADSKIIPTFASAFENKTYAKRQEDGQKWLELEAVKK